LAEQTVRHQSGQGLAAEGLDGLINRMARFVAAFLQNLNDSCAFVAQCYAVLVSHGSA